MDEIRKLYNSLLEDKDLYTFFPGAKGNWDADKKMFERHYEEQQTILNDIEIDDSEVL